MKPSAPPSGLFKPSEPLKQTELPLLKRLALAIPIGIACGLASALFLFLLDYVTQIRVRFVELHYLLPLGGVIVGGLYTMFATARSRRCENKRAIDLEKGNNLLLDEFHTPRSVVPFRMAPLVLIGTLITHLFGGSAGREGTAVQMGGTLADRIGTIFKIALHKRRSLLMIGMSAGFGSVFGVPFAGAVFGIEVFSIGKLDYRNSIECLIGALIAHFVTLACGLHHTAYPQIASVPLTFRAVGAALMAGVLFGLTARLFVYATDGFKLVFTRISSSSMVRAACGGALLALAFYLSPSLMRFAGLGVPVILDSFQTQLAPSDWLLKLAATALTLGSGFKGGEVTPLLFIGSTLGNALSTYLPLELPTLAAIGLVGVFAGAANTPLACTIMALELFGVAITPYAALACFAAYYASGHHGIYSSQRVHRRKWSKLKFAPRS